VFSSLPVHPCRAHTVVFSFELGIQKVKYLVQKKPSPPTLNAQLQLHKPDIPISPIIYNQGALSYKLAKHLSTILKNHITLNNYYNATNSTQLADNLMKLNIHVHKSYNLTTYDIGDLYVNTPIEETSSIMKYKLLETNDSPTTQQIITLVKVVLTQNYLIFQNKIYQPDKGISMGFPISSIIAEI
jgi:hypothetical protein